MNYSMMFKKMICIILFIPILLCHRVNANANSDLDIQMPDGNGNFLIVYSDRYDQSIENSVETIVNLVTAMGKVADYGSVKECMQIIDKYKYVICLGLEDEEEFCQKLNEYNGKVMVLGTSFMAQYLEICNYEKTWKLGPASRGQLKYSFSDTMEYNEIIKPDGLIVCNDFSYSSGEIQAGQITVPFCSQIAGIRYIPITEFESKIVKAALIRELALWLWPYKDAVPDYAQYLVLDEVYPFMNASILKEKIDMMIEEEVPFTLSVMPVAQNEDYPSMKEFCQVLSYAQQNRGTVILHAPIIHKNIEDIEELYKKLTDMTMAFVNQGVYPIGIEVPLNWLNNEVYLKILERYSTCLR